jgi:predicted nucleic-acid-binding protein
MRSIDTSILVRLIAQDDDQQVASAKEFIGKGAWVSHLVLVETLRVLQSVYDRTRGQIAAIVEVLLNHAELSLQEQDVVEAALEHFTKHKGVSFSDVLILEIARKNGHVPLGTFDRDLAKLEGSQRL